MTKGEAEYAERMALSLLDNWLGVTGVFRPGDSYYGEIVSIVKDSVHCGIQTAIFGNVELDEDGVKRDRNE